MLQFLKLLTLTITLAQSSIIPISGKRNTPSPLKIDFKVSRPNGSLNGIRPELGKRDAFSAPIIDYADVIYYAQMQIGSNKQPGNVYIDTGSSILWVPKNHYDPSKSTTAKDTGNPFKIAYLDGSNYKGEYYLDTVQFANGGPSLSDFYFAKADLSLSHGLLGIADLFSSKSRNDSNFIRTLQNQGYISKASYSLFLGPDHGTGSVIFGGIDTEKYNGDLVTYDVSKYLLDSRVPVESVNVNGKIIQQTGQYVLDSGTSLTLVSKELFDELFIAFNATTKNGYHYVDCNQPSDKFIEFNFGKNTISVPFSNSLSRHGKTNCWLGFSYSGGTQILGDTFLRNAYVYFDFTNKKISLAQALYSESSNIITDW